MFQERPQNANKNVQRKDATLTQGIAVQEESRELERFRRENWISYRDGYTDIKNIAKYLSNTRKADMPISGQRKVAAATSIHATHLHYHSMSHLIQHCNLSRSVGTNQLMTSPIGLRAKHLVTPPAKPTCTLVGRSGPSCGEEFVAANAFQLFNATTPTIFVVNVLLMLCCGPIPPRSVRRKPNLETAQTRPINHSIGIRADFSTKRSCNLLAFM